MSNRVKAVEILEKITDFDNNGCSHQEILEYLIKNFLSGEQALECMQAAEREFFQLDEETDEDECPECGSTHTVDWDFDYAHAQKVFKCKDCGLEFKN